MEPKEMALHTVTLTDSLLVARQTHIGWQTDKSTKGSYTNSNTLAVFPVTSPNYTFFSLHSPA